jgi:hypothetical protein
MKQQEKQTKNTQEDAQSKHHQVIQGEPRCSGNVNISGFS